MLEGSVLVLNRSWVAVHIAPVRRALTLGVDRDSDELAELFNEQDEAVKWMIRTVIEAAARSGAKVGLCGQAPSDHPEFAAFLVECGIDSISVSPDSFIAVKQHFAQAEALQRSP